MGYEMIRMLLPKQMNRFINQSSDTQMEVICRLACIWETIALVSMR